MSETGTATLIADYGFSRSDRADQRLYRLNPPTTREHFDLDTDEASTEPVEYVIVSACDVYLSGPETYLFAANESGEITYWGELPGSSRGDLDHEGALRRAGYEVASTPVSAPGAASDTSSSHLPESHGAQCLAVTTFTKVEQAIVAARFLDSLGIAARSLTVTPLGRVECEIDRDRFDMAARVARVEYGATVHHEPGGVFVEARIDGVPVQLWAGVA